MGRYQDDKDQRGFSRYRESDSYDEPRFDTDGTFSHSNFSFEVRRPVGRFKGKNRFGEENIHPDSYQDDQFRDDYDPTYEDEYGMKHPYEHGGESNRWSDDIRSVASSEDYRGKGPKGYQRSDSRIFEEACEILTRNPQLDASEIELEVTDGCIFLKGEVSTRRDKRLAEDLVDRISGVKDVWNQIKINKNFDLRGPSDWDHGDHPEGPIKGLY